MRSDIEVNLHLLFVATLRRLQGYADLVRENRSVTEALDFGRYVINSRLCDLLATLETQISDSPGTPAQKAAGVGAISAASAPRFPRGGSGTPPPLIRCPRAVTDLRPEAPGGLKVDSSLLRWTAEELVRACTERFRLNDTKPHIEALQLQSINQKLDTIAGYLSKCVASGGAGKAGPELQVISGGLEEPPVLEGRNGTAENAYAAR